MRGRRRLGAVFAAAVLMMSAVSVRGASSGNLDGHDTYGFSVHTGATSYLVEAVDGDNIVWGSETVSVSGSYHEHSLAYIKSQLPLSGYPDLSLRATVATGSGGCGCIGSQSTVDILDLLMLLVQLLL